MPEKFVTRSSFERKPELLDTLASNVIAECRRQFGKIELKEKIGC